MVPGPVSNINGSAETKECLRYIFHIAICVLLKRKALIKKVLLSYAKLVRMLGSFFVQPTKTINYE